MKLGSMKGDPSKAGFPTVNLGRMIRFACFLHYKNMDSNPLLNTLNKVLPTKYDLEATRTNK